MLQVWTDGYCKSRGDANFLTLWKPVAPPGYVAMGLLASTGAREPQGFSQVSWACVVESSVAFCVCVYVPQGCHRSCAQQRNVGLRSHAGRDQSGLLCMVCISHILPHPVHPLPGPLTMQVRCVRADLATRVDFQPNSPALIFLQYKQRPALAGWIADERAATFVVVSHDGTPQVLEGYRLKEPEQIRREKMQQEGVVEEQTGTCCTLHCRAAVLLGVEADGDIPAQFLTPFKASMGDGLTLWLVWLVCRRIPCPADVPVGGQDQPAAAQPAAHPHPGAGGSQAQPG